MQISEENNKDNYLEIDKLIIDSDGNPVIQSQYTHTHLMKSLYSLTIQDKIRHYAANKEVKNFYVFWHKKLSKGIEQNCSLAFCIDRINYFRVNDENALLCLTPKYKSIEKALRSKKNYRGKSSTYKRKLDRARKKFVQQKIDILELDDRRRTMLHELDNNPNLLRMYQFHDPNATTIDDDSILYLIHFLNQRQIPLHIVTEHMDHTLFGIWFKFIIAYSGTHFYNKRDELTDIIEGSEINMYTILDMINVARNINGLLPVYYVKHHFNSITHYQPDNYDYSKYFSTTKWDFLSKSSREKNLLENIILNSLDFTGTNYLNRTFNIDGFEFKYAFLRKCLFLINLHNVNFRSCFLEKSRFIEDIVITGTVFEYSNLSFSSFENCRMKNCKFLKCKLDCAEFRKCTFINCDFDFNYSYEFAIKCKFYECKFNRCNFKHLLNINHDIYFFNNCLLNEPLFIFNRKKYDIDRDGVFIPSDKSRSSQSSSSSISVSSNTSDSDNISSITTNRSEKYNVNNDSNISSLTNDSSSQGKKSFIKGEVYPNSLESDNSNSNNSNNESIVTNIAVVNSNSTQSNRSKSSKMSFGNVYREDDIISESNNPLFKGKNVTKKKSSSSQSQNSPHYDMNRIVELYIYSQHDIIDLQNYLFELNTFFQDTVTNVELKKIITQLRNSNEEEINKINEELKIKKFKIPESIEKKFKEKKYKDMILCFRVLNTIFDSDYNFDIENQKLFLLIKCISLIIIDYINTESNLFGYFYESFYDICKYVIIKQNEFYNYLITNKLNTNIDYYLCYLFIVTLKMTLQNYNNINYQKIANIEKKHNLIVKTTPNVLKIMEN